MTGKVVIATTTMYRSAKEVRAQLAMKMAEEAQSRGYTMVCADSGSPENFTENLTRRGHRVLSVIGSFGAAVRTSIRAASQLVAPDGAVVRMEPEKWNFVKEIEPCTRAILSGQADYVHPTRKSIASYPEEQRCGETLQNLFFHSITGLTWDVCFGPMILGAKAIPFYLQYQGEHGDQWDSLGIPMLRMVLSRTVRCQSREVDWTYPPEQDAAESGIPEYIVRRVRQAYTMITAYYAEWQKLTGEK